MGRTNSQIAHLWAHQGKSSAEGSHLSFYGPTLYSYYTAIGWLDVERGVAFVSSNSMTSSTSKHVGHAGKAVRGQFRHVVYTPSFRYGKHDPETPAFMLKAAAAKLIEDFKALPRKRTNLGWAIQYYTERRDELLTVAAIYKIKIALPEASGDLKAKAAEIAIKEEKARKAQEAKDRKAHRLAVKEAEKNLEQWLNGEDVRLPSVFTSFMARAEMGELLTVRGDIVVTSLGAEVPLSHAKKALRAYRTKTRPWERNGENIHVGHFQIDLIDINGNVKAGCHNFKAAEIERFAKQWGLEE